MLVEDSVLVEGDEPPAGVEAEVLDVLLVLVVFVDECVELPPPAGEGFTIVVLCSVLFVGEPPAAGVTVSDFCSQAARSATLANAQMYFFIGLMGSPASGYSLIRNECSIRLPNDNFAVTRANQNAGSCGKPCASPTAAIVSLPSRVLIPPTSAESFLHAPSRPRSASNSTYRAVALLNASVEVRA